ncbi:hypothetical protein TanjilG_07340 [Lupinus angustifolius]|uniref:Aminotransferase-like plant mobile domain-containing protein n=1 Tax=Lupinus angustifolius TaxID=3871 RepID=A0A4P1R0B4_LUPAN|nr:hypothetical protein TanjilG_07340 [Lupinus angustifolius]
MDAESVDSIIEVREDVMVSPSSVGNPTCTRTAYFIKPCIKQCSPCHILPPTHYMLSGTLNSSKYNHSKLALDVRVSELVGMGCREQYLPHRVAMQFGMDQDIPGMVEPSHTGSLVNYYIWDRNLCKALCPCQCQPNVTFRYYNWWKQSNIDSSRMDDSRIAKNEWNETRRKSSFVNEMQSREVASPCIAQEKVFNLENRILKLEREVAILKLEREVAKLKAARLAPKFENIGAKTKPCISSRPAIQKVYIRRNKHGFELNLEAKFENSGAKAHNNTESLNSKWVQTRSRSFKE